MPLPKINEANLAKPLCYDPSRNKFIYFDEIVSRKEPIVPVDTLSDNDFKKLVIERQRAGPDYKVQAISGPPYSRNDVIRAIEHNEPFGKVTLEAEKSALRDLLAQIQKNLN